MGNVYLKFDALVSNFHNDSGTFASNLEAKFDTVSRELCIG